MASEVCKGPLSPYTAFIIFPVMSSNKVEFLCNHGRTTFGCYKEFMHKLDHDESKMTEISTNRSSVNLSVGNAELCLHYLSRCGHRLIAVMHNGGFSGRVSVLERAYQPGDNLTKLLDFELKIAPYHLIVTPNENHCLIIGRTTRDRIMIIYYRLDLCGNSVCFEKIHSKNLEKCEEHYRSNTISALSWNQDKLVLFTHNHMMAYEMGARLNCIKMECLKNFIAGFDEEYEIVAASWTSHDKFFFTARDFQLFEYSLIDDTLLTLSISGDGYDSLYAHLVGSDLLLRVFRHHSLTNDGNIQQFFLLSSLTDKGNALLFRRSFENSLELVKAFDLIYDTIGEFYNDWDLLDLQVDQETAACFVLLGNSYFRRPFITTYTFAYKIYSFNLLNPRSSIFMFDFSKMKLWAPKLIDNSTNNELLLIDSEGLVVGYRLPAQGMSLKLLAKSAVLRVFRRSEIPMLEIPKSLVRFLLA